MSNWDPAVFKVNVSRLCFYVCRLAGLVKQHLLMEYDSRALRQFWRLISQTVTISFKLDVPGICLDIASESLNGQGLILMPLHMLPHSDKTAQ